jgi:hypothetical protein
MVEEHVNDDDIRMSTVDPVQPKKAGKGGKKATKAKNSVGKAKGKLARAKQEESQIASSCLEPEDDDFEVKVAQVPPPSTTSKKSSSDGTSTVIEDVTVSQGKAREGEYESPPKKKRATRTRSRVVPAQAVPEPIPQNQDEVDIQMIDAEGMPPSSVPASEKNGRSSRERASSTTRKVSGASTASKATLRACVPDDEEIDAALEAELDRPLTDEEGDVEPPTIEPSKGRRLTRSRPRSCFSDTQKATDLASNIKSSIIDTQSAQDDSLHETDASVVKNGRAKRGSRKISTTTTKAKDEKKDVAASRNIEDIVQTAPNEKPSEETKYQPDVMAIDNEAAKVELVAEEVPTSKRQCKEMKASTKTSKGKKPTAKSKGVTRKASIVSSHAGPINGAEETTLPQPPSAHPTPKPALCPQSSDAENQLPLSRRSAQRPSLSLQSPSESQTTRVPLAPATPTASPSKGTVVDLERLSQGIPPVDKENIPFIFGHALPESGSVLTSPEKKLSVEQWIHFNAQRGEEKLRSECERLVGRFEGEGMKALKALEGIKCTE